MQYNSKAQQLKSVAKDKPRLAKNPALLVTNIQITVPKVNDPKQHNTKNRPILTQDNRKPAITVIKQQRLTIIYSLKIEATTTFRAEANPTVDDL
jgi:hypothetical protein